MDSPLSNWRRLHAFGLESFGFFAALQGHVSSMHLTVLRPDPTVHTGVLLGHTSFVKPGGVWSGGLTAIREGAGLRTDATSNSQSSFAFLCESFLIAICRNNHHSSINDDDLLKKRKAVVIRHHFLRSYFPRVNNNYLLLLCCC